ncbi:dUTPase protein [Saguinine gammaherpesvirus 1]|uniref:dUTPase protein n=1 Tax=Saguinine gammaherpesvirus 1 TaxID=2169901 RepID=A0A9Q8VJ90_9GAMA|nr:dUTPase protein [Saguinine gammaherpesvirus 1]
MSSSVSYQLGTWNIITEGGIFLLKNDTTIHRTNNSPFRSLTLPFSLNDLINSAVYGLVPTLLDLKTFKRSLGLITAAKHGNIGGDMIVPMLIWNYDAPLTFWINNNKLPANPGTICLSIVLIDTIPTNQIATSIHKSNEDYPSEITLIECTEAVDQILIEGQMNKLNKNTYEAYFRHNTKLPDFLTVRDLAVAAICSPEELKVKHLLVTTYVRNPGLFKLKLEVLNHSPPEEIVIHLNLIKCPEPAILTYHYHLALQIPDRGTVFPLFAESEKVIKPGDYQRIKIKTTYVEAHREDNLTTTFFITGITTQTGLVVNPSIWTSLSHPNILVSNNSSDHLIISKNQLVAAASPLISTPTDPRAIGSGVLFHLDTLKITWDGVTVHRGPGGLLHSPTYVKVKDNSSPDPMDF